MENYQNLAYQKGFGNSFSTEAVEGVIPLRKFLSHSDQNSPIKLKKGVFAEQLNGTAFTVKRAENQRSWLYKVRPSVTQGQYKESTFPFKIVESYLSKENISFNPNQLRWKRIPEVK